MKKVSSIKYYKRQNDNIMPNTANKTFFVIDA